MMPPEAMKRLTSIQAHRLTAAWVSAAPSTDPMASGRPERCTRIAASHRLAAGIVASVKPTAALLRCWRQLETSRAIQGARRRRVKMRPRGSTSSAQMSRMTSTGDLAMRESDARESAPPMRTNQPCTRRRLSWPLSRTCLQMGGASRTANRRVRTS